MRGTAPTRGFRALLMQHAEKGIFGLAALLGFAALGTTRWSHYEGTPERITEKVRKHRAELDARLWPAEERQQFTLTPDQLPAQLVYEHLRREYRPESYPFPMEFSTRFRHSLHGGRPALKEPVLARLDEPFATAGRVLIQKAPIVPNANRPGPDERAEPAPRERLPDELLPRGQFGPGSGGRRSPDLVGPAVDRLRGPIPGSTSEAGAVPVSIAADGYHYVSVRAVFPIKDQIRQYAEAIHRPFADAARAFDIIDFQLERQALDSPWDTRWSDWSPVDRAAAEQVLTSSDGFDPEGIAGTVTNSVMTMPLPRRVFGQWFSDATHPALEQFRLSEKEIQEQLAYQRKLVERYAEANKAAPRRIERGGFARYLYDNRDLQAQLLTDPGPAGPQSGIPASPGFGGRPTFNAPFPLAGNPTRPPQGPRTAPVSPDEILRRLAAGDRQGVDRALQEFIRTRATVEGELLLFRYLDFAVEPGKTYRYRVRLELLNPNFGRQPSEANGESSVVQGETRLTRWSDVTEPAFVKPDVDYFVAGVETRKSLPQARLTVFQWDSKLGTVVQGAVETFVGQFIGGTEKAEVIDPPNRRIETTAYTFASKDLLVDAFGDEQVSPKFHPDLKFATSRGDLGLPARLLVADERGRLHDVDAYASAAEEQKARRYMAYQTEAFQWLRDLAAAALQTDSLMDLVSPGATSREGMPRPGAKNQTSPLRKGGGSSSPYRTSGSGSGPTR